MRAMPRFEVSQNLRFVFSACCCSLCAGVLVDQDQSRYSNEELTQWALYEADAHFSEAQLASGVDPAQVTATFPHVEVVGDTARPRLAISRNWRPGASQESTSTAGGGFFLVVLLGMMLLLSRTIQAEATLRRRRKTLSLRSPMSSEPLASCS